MIIDLANNFLYTGSSRWERGSVFQAGWVETCLNWESEALLVSGGTTQQRKNSEGEDIRFLLQETSSPTTVLMADIF